jgi:hypothetical protein
MVEDNPLDLENIKEKQDEDNILQIYIHWHIMDTIIFVIPTLSIAIATSLRTLLKIIPWIYKTSRRNKMKTMIFNSH